MTGAGYRKSTQRLSQRLGLNRFFDWWLGELSAVVPRSLIGASKAKMERRVLVKVSGSLVTFSRAMHGKAAEAGRLDMASIDAAGQRQAFQSELDKVGRQNDEVALYLTQEEVLQKKLFLPLETEENLRQVIAFEMDRYTPFNAGQVYFDYRLARRDKQLEVSLVVAPRNAIDEPLRQLATWGARVTAVLVDEDVADGAPWNLLPGGQQQESKDKQLLRLNIALAFGAVFLLGVVLFTPIWKKRETVLALAPLLDKAHHQAEAADNLRRQLEASIAEYNYLIDKKRESPPVVAVLDDVTRALPDDTWVQQFDLKGKEMQIQGETASSYKLVGLFEQAKTLHNASFRAPLTKGQSANSERFHLAADTRPLPRAETGSPTITQPLAVPPAPGENAAASAAAAATLQEKDKAGKPLPAIPDVAKTGDKPAAAKGEAKPASAPAARTESKQ